MLLGCIGDDFTGSSDLGLTLAKEGMRTAQYCGVPSEDADAEIDAGVVALKSRTCPKDQAIEDSLATLNWLRAQGCRQYLFKYCSTFDSTPDGNIGPVLEALMKALDVDHAIVCPAFPATGRTLYQGHLFVNDRLLSESGMQHHPLTPMTDSDIRRWLSLQTESEVGHIAHGSVAVGADTILFAMEQEIGNCRPILVIDAVSETDLRQIGEACRNTVLVSGGSGIGLGLPANFGFEPKSAQSGTGWKGKSGGGAVLAGSCSTATREQILRYSENHPAHMIDVADVMEAKLSADELVAWIMENIEKEPILYSSADPNVVTAAQERYGREPVAAAIEGLFSSVAQRICDAGVQRLVVAGGETSGAVAEGLGLRVLNIGPEIAPGVPALDVAERNLAIALKSGNFGDSHFFEKAMAVLGDRHV